MIYNMTFNIMTIFPAEVDAFLSSSIIGRARKKGVIEVNCFDIRDYTLDKHNRVDDYAYGRRSGYAYAGRADMQVF